MIQHSSPTPDGLVVQDAAAAPRQGIARCSAEHSLLEPSSPEPRAMQQSCNTEPGLKSLAFSTAGSDQISLWQVNWEFWTNSNDQCGAICNAQKEFIKARLACNMPKCMQHDMCIVWRRIAALHARCQHAPVPFVAARADPR